MWLTFSNAITTHKTDKKVLQCIVSLPDSGQKGEDIKSIIFDRYTQTQFVLYILIAQALSNPPPLPHLSTPLPPPPAPRVSQLVEPLILAILPLQLHPPIDTCMSLSLPLLIHLPPRIFFPSLSLLLYAIVAFFRSCALFLFPPYSSLIRYASPPQSSHHPLQSHPLPPLFLSPSASSSAATFYSRALARPGSPRPPASPFPPSGTHDA